MTARKRTILLLLLLAGSLACAASRTTRSAEDSSGQFQFLGVASCSGCHSKKSPAFEKFPRDFVQLTEYDIWLHEDKHARAYDVLKQDLARKMGKILGYQPWKKDACLNCHAVNVPEERQAPSFRREDGVSCEACHGPARKWLSEHYQETWRLQPGRHKEAWGMIDLRDPAKRTTLCLSCHLGNASEGKFVTHEMYAAGHPRLPSFEAATFCKNLPQHWRPLKEVPFLKSPKLKKMPGKFKDREALKEAVEKLYQLDSAGWEETRLATVGGTVVLRKSLKALTGLTQETIDFAHFDCFACHHDLKSPNWRQQRLPRGNFGRPSLAIWPQALVRLAIRQAARKDTQKYRRLHEEFASHLKAVHHAVGGKPFGESSQRKASDKLQEWTARLLDDLGKSTYDLQGATKLLNELYELSQEKALDYDAARQIAWAFKRIHEEAYPRNAATRSAVWLELDREMRLNVPSRTVKGDNTLEAVNDFNPDLFARRLREVSGKPQR